VTISIVIYFQYSVKYFLQTLEIKQLTSNHLIITIRTILRCTAPAILVFSVLARVWTVVFLAATLWLFPVKDEVASPVLVRLRLMVLRRTGTDRA